MSLGRQILNAADLDTHFCAHRHYEPQPEAWPARGRLGVRREAKRHAALDGAEVSCMSSAFPQPLGGDPKRRRRCALPAHCSKTWREIEALDGLAR